MLSYETFLIALHCLGVQNDIGMFTIPLSNVDGITQRVQEVWGQLARRSSYV